MRRRSKAHRFRDTELASDSFIESGLFSENPRSKRITSSGGSISEQLKTGREPGPFMERKNY